MLSENWITEKTTDFEYKKYIALGYLQSVYKSFEESKIYPVLPQLKRHNQLLELILNNQNHVANHLPKRISGINWENLVINYAEQLQSELNEVNKLIDFALPLFKKAAANGESLKQEIQMLIDIKPLGVVPIYQKEGFLLFQPPTEKITTVYKYSSYTLTQSGNYTYSFVQTTPLSIETTYHKIKASLATSSDLPVPATYLISLKKQYPTRAAFIPLACELFEEYHSETKQ